MLPSLMYLGHKATRPTECCEYGEHSTGLPVFALMKLPSKVYKGWKKANEALNQAEAKLAQARKAIKDGAEVTKNERAIIQELVEEMAQRVRDLEEAATAKEEAVRRTAN